jgi:hypothetical protein
MTAYKASRTLVKSPPELWSEVSEAGSLKRHLDQFGEIRITRLEPETAVAWEGESARGTIKLEPSGWGTKVILTAQPDQAGTDPSPPGATSSAAAIEAEMRELKAVLELRKPASGRRAFMRRSGVMRALVSWFKGGEPIGTPAVTETLEAEGDSQPTPAAQAADPLGSAAAPALALNSALDSLGRAHHRPYSRA